MYCIVRLFDCWEFGKARERERKGCVFWEEIKARLVYTASDIIIAFSSLNVYTVLQHNVPDMVYLYSFLDCDFVCV